jgi:hypothetical protein
MNILRCVILILISVFIISADNKNTNIQYDKNDIITFSEVGFHFRCQSKMQFRGHNLIGIFGKAQNLY